MFFSKFFYLGDIDFLKACSDNAIREEIRYQSVSLFAKESNRKPCTKAVVKTEIPLNNECNTVCLNTKAHASFTFLHNTMY